MRLTAWEAGLMVVPMGNLQAEYQLHKADIDASIQRVVNSGQFVMGEELASFEQEFATYCGSSYAVGVGSGTAALHLAALACGVGPGDEVITVANTDIPTTMAITHAGASIEWVDTDRRTFNIDPNQIETKITKKTKAILPVHLFGNPADMDAVMDIGRRHDLIVIEDAALAVGAEYRGRKVGSIGHVGCFSLAPSKILGAYGDGGIVVTDDAQMAERLRVLRNYGHGPEMTVDDRESQGVREWRVLEEGYNERLDTLQAAIVRAKLPTLEERIERRRRTAATYDEALGELGVAVPTETSGARHVYWAYTILMENRDGAREFLAARGIATRVHYVPSLHLQPAYARLGYKPGAFPVTESNASKMLALPIFPEITQAQVQEVTTALSEFLGSRPGYA
jgi:dTDP-4-amino-4,6-dideoxygalactose transaminase